MILKKIAKQIARQLGVKDSLRNVTYKGTGFAVRNKNISFMSDEKFSRAWDFSHERNRPGWKDNVPDFRWQSHLACFAAHHGLSLDGDFAEFGVHTALLSATICKFLDFDTVGKKFYLFDTYEGIPVGDSISAKDSALAQHHNENTYFDCFDIVKETFSDYPNVALVKGLLPESLDQIDLGKLAYVSIDLNNAEYEKQVIERTWDKISDSAFILIDDYAYKGHEEQYDMWNSFAESKSRMIYTAPTGQGLLIK